MEFTPFRAVPGQLRGAATVPCLIASYTLKQPLQTETFRYAVACCCLAMTRTWCTRWPSCADAVETPNTSRMPAII